jgi:toxin-antitoxin system PIN domain toxin
VRIVDTSVLLPAVTPSLPHHTPARTALEAAINSDRPVGLTWVVVNAFLRLTTRPGLFERPLGIDEAWDLVDAWLEHPNVRVVQETDEHARLWSDLLRGAGVGGDLTTDAWIAAIAIAHGASVLTLDSDFGRFPNLRHESPLDPPS